ncbi:unnamed protein product [Closterium sp. Yama58-4]|nr:unnamed protein product [Closterium sp. Yama58-4]
MYTNTLSRNLRSTHYQMPRHPTLTWRFRKEQPRVQQEGERCAIAVNDRRARVYALVYRRVDSARIMTGRRFLEGSSAELDRALIPRCGDRLGDTCQEGRGGGETEAERPGEENGRSAGEERERGNGWNAGSEPLKRERAGIGSGDADSVRAGDGVCEARSWGACGAGDGVCACGHVRLLMFPGEGALPVGDWWRWYLARRQLAAQHLGERGGAEQRGVEGGCGDRPRESREEKGCGEWGGVCGKEEKVRGEWGGGCGEEEKGRGEWGGGCREEEKVCGKWSQKCGAEAQGCGQWIRECGEGYDVTLVVIDGTWEHAREMMKASGSFLRRHCAMVCLPFDLASPGPPPGHLGLVVRKEPHKGALCSPTVLPCRRHTLPHTLPLVDVAVPHASPHRRPRFFPLSITLHSVVDHALPPVTHASPHCRLRSHPPSLSHFPPPRPRFPPPSLTLSLTAAHAPSCLPPRFPTPSLAPSPTFPHASPHITHAFPHRRARFLPPSPTLSPTVALASSHRRPRFPPPSRSLPPTVAHAFPHRSSPTLHLTVAHASSHRRPRFPPPSPTLPLTVAHASPHCRPWQVVVRLWSRVLGAQPGQRVQAGSKECSAAGGCRPPLPLSSSLPPSIPHSLPHYPLSPFCCPFSLPFSRPPFLPFSLSSSSLDPVPLSLSISLSPTPFLTPTLLLRSTHPLIRPSSHPPILSSAHPLIRPSSLRRPHCLPLSLHSLPPSPTLPPHPCTLLSFSLILPSPRSSLIPCHTFTSLTFSHPPFLQASLLPTTLPPTLSFILLPLHPAALFFKLPSSDIPILRLSV